jgi:uncharacterized membrane protein
MSTPSDDYLNRYFLNESGQVAGRASDTHSTNRAAFYNGQTLTTIDSPNYPSSYSTGLNDVGDVVGSLVNFSSSTREAFIYRNGTVQYLGKFGGNSAEAIGINNTGTVIGTIDRATDGWSSTRNAFILRNGVLTELNLGPWINSTWSIKINDAGQFIGRYYSSGMQVSDGSFLWTPAGLNLLGSLGGNHTEAVDLNEKGDVVGWSYTSTQSSAWESSHAFLKPANAPIQVLGTLGGQRSAANDINDNGDVVG